jgi:predicted HTH domain antitoxin
MQRRRNTMATVTVEVPDDAFSALRRSPKEFAREMRLAAAIQWYHQGLVSQGKAAEIAGLKRREFLDALFHAKIEACQVDIDELKEEVERGLQARRERLTPDLPDQGEAP